MIQKFIFSITLFIFLSCNSTWNFNGRYYKPVKNEFENDKWKIVIKQMNESEESGMGIRSLKIRFSFQNKTKKYRVLKLMGGDEGKYTKEQFKYMIGRNKNGIGDVYRRDPKLIDEDYLYNNAGTTLLLKSKLMDTNYPDHLNKVLKYNKGNLYGFCQGQDSGNGNDSPFSISDWLAPNQTREEYINCNIYPGTYPVKFFSEGDFEIDIDPEIYYHPKVLNKFEGALK